MIDGFIKLDSHRFYTEAWAKVKQVARTAHMQRENAKPHDDYPVVAESNWKEVSKCKKAGIPSPVLLIYWGYKDEATGEKTILAITRSGYEESDEHWISPSLILP